MSEPEIAFFSDALGQASNYLEYGSGGSTKLAAGASSVSRMTSVESDRAFLESVVLSDPEVQRAVRSSRLRFQIADIGPTGEWGVPKNSAKSHLWPNYALCPYLDDKCQPDLILVDGRFRVACSLAAALQAPTATVLIHDYTIRPEYHVLERYFKIERVIDTLAECRRSPDFDQRSARAFLQLYLYAPMDESQTLPVRTRRHVRELGRRLLTR